jgi:uncharacterized protein YegP (UPF0339 family)
MWGLGRRAPSKSSAIEASAEYRVSLEGIEYNFVSCGEKGDARLLPVAGAVDYAQGVAGSSVWGALPDGRQAPERKQPIRDDSMAGKFELKKGASGKFSFNLKAGNGQVIFTSQAYDSKRSASAGIRSVKKNALTDARFERKTASNGQAYFVLTATNGQTIGKSQMYSGLAGMEKGIRSVVKNAPDAPVVDLTSAD